MYCRLYSKCLSSSVRHTLAQRKPATPILIWLQAFEGAKAGWVFTTRSQGLGYYRDTPPPMHPQEPDGLMQPSQLVQSILAQHVPHSSLTAAVDSPDAKQQPLLDQQTPSQQLHQTEANSTDPMDLPMDSSNSSSAIAGTGLPQQAPVKQADDQCAAQPSQADEPLAQPCCQYTAQPGQGIDQPGAHSSDGPQKPAAAAAEAQARPTTDAPDSQQPEQKAQASTAGADAARGTAAQCSTCANLPAAEIAAPSGKQAVVPPGQPQPELGTPDSARRAQAMTQAQAATSPPSQPDVAAEIQGSSTPQATERQADTVRPSSSGAGVDAGSSTQPDSPAPGDSAAAAAAAAAAASPRQEHYWGQALQYLDRSAPIEPDRRLLLLAKRDGNQACTHWSCCIMLLRWA